MGGVSSALAFFEGLTPCVRPVARPLHVPTRASSHLPVIALPEARLPVVGSHTPALVSGVFRRHASQFRSQPGPVYSGRRGRRRLASSSSAVSLSTHQCFWLISPH